jgi:hypothetical protein
MSGRYYLYMLHEFPVCAPYYCTVGIAAQPLRRLAQLQAGNPRPLRAWNHDRRPTEQFGLILPSKALAIELEQRVLESFGEMGVRLRQDYNYATDTAKARAWFEGVKPQEVWLHMLKLYTKFVREKGISDQVGL